jgi:MFS family permease
MGVLVAANLILAQEIGVAGLVAGILLWGAHMALTQGVFARMIADVAPDHLRATTFGAFYFVSGIGTLLASLAAGFIWDRDGAATTFIAGAGAAAVALAMLSLLQTDRRIA